MDASPSVVSNEADTLTSYLLNTYSQLSDLQHRLSLFVMSLTGS